MKNIKMLYAVVTVLLGMNLQPCSAADDNLAAKREIARQSVVMLRYCDDSSCVFSSYSYYVVWNKLYESADVDTKRQILGQELRIAKSNVEFKPDYNNISVRVASPKCMRFENISIPFARQLRFDFSCTLSNEARVRGERLRQLTIAEITNAIANNEFPDELENRLLLLAATWMDEFADCQCSSDLNPSCSPLRSDEVAPLTSSVIQEVSTAIANKTVQEVNSAIEQGQLRSAEKQYLHDLAKQWVITMPNNATGRMITFHRIVSRLSFTWTYRSDRLWGYPFLSTFDGLFFTPAPRTMKLMRTNGNFAYCEKDGMQAIALPYRNSNVYMLILLPDEPIDVEEFAINLTGEKLIQYFNDTLETSRDISVIIPKFSVQSPDMGSDARFIYFYGFYVFKHHLEVHETGTGNEKMADIIDARVGECSGPSCAKKRCHLFSAIRPFIFAEIDTHQMVYMTGIYNGFP